MTDISFMFYDVNATLLSLEFAERSGNSSPDRHVCCIRTVCRLFMYFVFIPRQI